MGNEMTRIPASACYLCLFLFVSGCATTAHFTKLPKPDQFNKPVHELKAEYPDLTRKESIWSSLTIFDMPEVRELTDIWGEPHDTGFTYYMLIPVNWVFHPSNYYYWQFEGRKLSALIDRPLLFGYRPHVVTLRVSEELERTGPGSEDTAPDMRQK